MRYTIVKSQSGLSLLSVIFAMAIGGMVLFGASKMTKNIYDLQKILEIKSDLIVLRNYISGRFDCAETINVLPSKSCSIGDAILVKDRFNKLLISSSGDTIKGGYTLRAKCASCDICDNGKKILVEAQIRHARGSFKANSWVDLFNGIPIGCTLQ